MVIMLIVLNHLTPEQNTINVFLTIGPDILRAEHSSCGRGGGGGNGGVQAAAASCRVLCVFVVQQSFSMCIHAFASHMRSVNIAQTDGRTGQTLKTSGSTAIIYIHGQTTQI